MKTNLPYASFLLITFLASLAASPLQAEGFALIIGIKGYPHFEADQRLQYADEDARSFYEFIQTKAGGSFRRENIRLLINEEASRDNIFDAVSWLIRTTSESDTLYIFFSGHGAKDQQSRIYFMPYDGRSDLPASQGFRTDEFVNMLRETSARNIIFFIDACHSGSAFNMGLEKGGGQDLPSVFDHDLSALQKERQAGTLALLSAAANQVSREDHRLRRGIFSWFLLAGLQGEADGVGGIRDGVVTANELFRYLSERVETYSKKNFGAAQTPTRSPMFDPDFPLSWPGISMTVATPKSVLPKNSVPSTSAGSATQFPQPQLKPLQKPSAILEVETSIEKEFGPGPFDVLLSNSVVGQVRDREVLRVQNVPEGLSYFNLRDSKGVLLHALVSGGSNGSSETLRFDAGGYLRVSCKIDYSLHNNPYIRCVQSRPRR